MSTVVKGFLARNFPIERLLIRFPDEELAPSARSQPFPSDLPSLLAVVPPRFLLSLTPRVEVGTVAE